MYHPTTERTNTIHGRIITVCDNLTTRTASKKHGGYNIYEDDKIVATKDTFVPNVNLSVKTSHGHERVFSCNMEGRFVTFHEGKWENYLETLYKKALEVAAKKKEETEKKLAQERAESFAPCSKDADEIFA